MLNRQELNKYGPPGFNMAQKEKDYIQHWILYYLSNSGFAGVFKGGTALQKAYNLPRYSEDLDFTLNGQKLPDLESLASFLGSSGLEGIKMKKNESKISETVKMRLQGPLYNGNEISEATVVLEFSKREKTFLDAQPIIIRPTYPDILPYSSKVMHKDEISAEKIRAIITRRSARDLYDLYFLFRQNIKIDIKLVNEKLKYYKKEFDKSEFEKQVLKLKILWKKEIETLTPNVLDYDFVAGEILAFSSYWLT